MTANVLPSSGGPRIVLLRHGETEWSRSGRHTGRSDIPLTPAGEEQARQAGDALGRQRFGLVLTSPRSRAVRTAELAGYGDCAVVEPALVEWDYGPYEGRTSAQIAEELGRPWNLWRDGVPVGDSGESAAEVLARANAVLAKARPVLDAGQNVLLVSHGHFLRVFASNWLGLGAAGGRLLGLDTASISALGFEHGEQVLRLWNRTPYSEHGTGSA